MRAFRTSKGRLHKVQRTDVLIVDTYSLGEAQLPVAFGTCGAHGEVVHVLEVPEFASPWAWDQAGYEEVVAQFDGPTTPCRKCFPAAYQPRR